MLAACCGCSQALPRLVIGSFSACSNVTGVLADVDAVTALLQCTDLSLSVCRPGGGSRRQPEHICLFPCWLGSGSRQP